MLAADLLKGRDYVQRAKPLDAACPLHKATLRLGFMICKGRCQKIRHNAGVDISSCFQPDPLTAAHCTYFN